MEKDQNQHHVTLGDIVWTPFLVGSDIRSSRLLEMDGLKDVDSLNEGVPVKLVIKIGVMGDSWGELLIQYCMGEAMEVG